MTESVTQGYIEFPSEWEHVESQHVGPFVTMVAHRKPDGSSDVRTSRRHRKHFCPEDNTQEKKRPSLFIWRPHSLNWWIALLFMIGAFHFIIGSLMVLAGSTDAYLIDFVYFIGSVVFTAGAYSQYNQAINAPDALDENGNVSATHKRRYFGWHPHRIDFWATFPKLLGTLTFNVMTLTSFLDLGMLGHDLLVWAPDFIGATLFLVSGTASVFEFCHHFWCWQWKNITWWIVMLAFAGCINFMISAFMVFARPDPIFNNLATWATIFTLIGAICFFVSSYLLWPKMAAEQTTGK